MKINFNDQNQCMDLFGKTEVGIKYASVNKKGEPVAIIEDANHLLHSFNMNDIYYGESVEYNDIKGAANSNTPSFNVTMPQQQAQPQVQAQVQQQAQPQQQAQYDDGMVRTEFMTFPKSLRLPDLTGRKPYNQTRENTIGSGNATMPSLGIDFSVFGAPQLNRTENTQQAPQPQIPQGFVLKGNYPHNGVTVPCYTNPAWWRGDEKQGDIWCENGVHYIKPHQAQQQPQIPQGFVLKGNYPHNGVKVPCYTNPAWWRGDEKQGDIWCENGVHYIKPHQAQQQPQTQQHSHNCGCGSHDHKCNCGHKHETGKEIKEDALAKKYHIKANRIDELVKAGILSDRLELKEKGKSEDEINNIVSSNIKSGKYRANAINELVKPAIIQEKYNNLMREEHYKDLTNVPEDIKKALAEAEETAKKYKISEERIQYVSDALENAIREECKGKFSDEDIEKDIKQNKSEGRYRINALQQCIDAAIEAEKKDEEEFQQVMKALMGDKQPQQQVQQPQVQAQQPIQQPQMQQPQTQLQQYQLMNIGGQQVMTYTNPMWWMQGVQPTSEELVQMQGVYVIVPRYNYTQPAMQMQPMYTGPYYEEPVRPQTKSIDWSKRITIERPASDKQQDAACTQKETTQPQQQTRQQAAQTKPQVKQSVQPQQQARQQQVAQASYSNVLSNDYKNSLAEQNEKIAYIQNMLNSCSSPQARQMVIDMLKKQGIVIPGISEEEMPDFSVFITEPRNPNYKYEGKFPRQSNGEVKDEHFHPEYVMGCDPMELMANMSYGDIDKLMSTPGSGVVVDNGVDESIDTSRPVYKQHLVGQEIPFDPYDIKNNFGNIHENVKRMMQENLYQNTVNNVPMYAGQPLTADNAIYVGGGRYVPKNPRPMYNPMMATAQARKQQEDYQKKQIEQAEIYKQMSRAVSHALGKEVDEERLSQMYDPAFIREKETQDKYWKEFEQKSDYERERDMHIRHCAMLSRMPSLQQIEEANRERKLQEMAKHQASFEGLSFFECIDKMNEEMAEEHYRKVNANNFKANLRYLYDSSIYNDSFKGMQLDQGESYIEGTTIPMKYKDRYERWLRAMDEEWGDLDG